MKNKKALITGATSGIGEATARLFAKNNIDLILCGRRKHRLEALKNELSGYAEATYLCFDVGNQKEVAEAIPSLPEKWKDIDILVNNAGGAHGLEFMAEADVSDWDQDLDYNVKGLLYVSKAIIPGMITRRTGHIVNISSIAGKQPYSKGVAYCASKAAVESISQGMRLELVPHGIKVTNIAPGAVETEFSKIRFKGDVERTKEVYKGFQPLLAQDIAQAIHYCIGQPSHIQIADLTIFPAAQSAATTIARTLNEA